MKFWECREIRHEFIFYGGKLFESIRNVVYEHTIKFDSRFRRKKLINPIRFFTIFIVQTLYKHSIPNIFAMSVHTEHTLKILRFLSRIDWYSSTLGTVNYFMVIPHLLPRRLIISWILPLNSSALIFNTQMHHCRN